MKDAALARKAAEQIGEALAKAETRLLVYGGPYLESDVVRGFVTSGPGEDRSILMCYSKDQEPPPFPEESSHPKLFEKRSEKGSDWETTFYRSVARADGIILIGGGSATKISGQVAIGARMPILALPQFGGAASQVWETLSPGEDLPTRAEINLMARPWSDGSAEGCVAALLAQTDRRRLQEGAPRPILSLFAAVLFLAALAIVPWMWGENALAVWMLFIAPVLAGGAGAAVRPMVARVRNDHGVASSVLVTVALGLIAGGVAGVLFVTAQLTADPQLTSGSDLVRYARRSIPFALGVGFVAGLTSDAVFGKLLGMDVVRTSTISPPGSSSS